jgi:copper chaperone
MSCGGCESAVKRAVGQLPGVETVTASHQEARVTITYDPARATRTVIEEKIRQLGYSVEA